MAVVPMYLMAGYLDTSDLEEYRLGFKNTDLLDTDEKKHIQDQIDFIIRRKDNFYDFSSWRTVLRFRRIGWGATHADIDNEE